MIKNIRKLLKPTTPDKADIEAEKGEVILTSSTDVSLPELYLIGGKKHKDGGSPLKIEEKAFIYSNSDKFKINDPDILFIFGLKPKNDGYTPAEIAKKYLDLNKYKEMMLSKESDRLTKDTAGTMISNYLEKLGILALLQESKKGFKEGIPEVALYYLEKNNVRPEDLLGSFLKNENGELEKKQEGGEESPTEEEIRKYYPTLSYLPSQLRDLALSNVQEQNTVPEDKSQLYQNLSIFELQYPDIKQPSLTLKEHSVKREGAEQETKPVNDKVNTREVEIPFSLFSFGTSPLDTLYSLAKRYSALMTNVEEKKLREKLSGEGLVIPTPAKKGDFVETGTAYGQFRPDKYVSALNDILLLGGLKKFQEGGEENKEETKKKNIFSSDDLSKLSTEIESVNKQLLESKYWEDVKNNKKSKDLALALMFNNVIHDLRSDIIEQWKKGEDISFYSSILSDKKINLDSNDKLAKDIRERWEDFLEYNPEFKEFVEKNNITLNDALSSFQKVSKDIASGKANYEIDGNPIITFGVGALEKKTGTSVSPVDQILGNTTLGEGLIVAKKGIETKNLITEQQKKNIEEAEKAASTNENSKVGKIPFVQDLNTLNLALNELLDLRRYLPHAVSSQLTAPEVTFMSPERAVAATKEEINRAYELASQFGPQALEAAVGTTGEKAMRTSADIVNQINKANVEIANRYSAMLSDIVNKKAIEEAELVNKLYQGTVISKQQYDNSIREARRNLIDALNNTISNMNKMYLLNKLNTLSGGVTYNPYTGEIEIDERKLEANKSKDSFEQATKKALKVKENVFSGTGDEELAKKAFLLTLISEMKDVASNDIVKDFILNPEKEAKNKMSGSSASDELNSLIEKFKVLKKVEG